MKMGVCGVDVGRNCIDNCEYCEYCCCGCGFGGRLRTAFFLENFLPRTLGGSVGQFRIVADNYLLTQFVDVCKIGFVVNGERTHTGKIINNGGFRMKDYITLTISKEQGIRLARDLLRGTSAFNWRAICANADVVRYHESAYFQERLADAQREAGEHEALLQELLPVIMTAGITFFDIRESNNDGSNVTQESA